MIEADIRRKFGPEDVLTSCCIGLLELLPESYLLEFLKKAVNLIPEPLTLSSDTSIKSIDFWPTFWSGFPDVVVKLSNNTVLIIEIKHGAHLHGYDQLTKYWCDAYREFAGSKIVLIYLTHHRSMPISDLKKSEYEAKEQCGEHCAKGGFYWLNWFTLFFCASDWLSYPGLLPYEKKILELLHRYLTSKGYVCFLSWDPLPTRVVVFTPYKKFYNWTVTSLSSVHTQIYSLGRSSLYKITTPRFYNYHYNWMASGKIPVIYSRT